MQVSFSPVCFVVFVAVVPGPVSLPRCRPVSLVRVLKQAFSGQKVDILIFCCFFGVSEVAGSVVRGPLLQPLVRLSLDIFRFFFCLFARHLALYWLTKRQTLEIPLYPFLFSPFFYIRIFFSVSARF